MVNRCLVTKFFLIINFVITLFATSHALADYGVNLALGRQMGREPEMNRYSFIKTLDVKWYETSNSYLTVYLDFSFLYWHATMQDDIQGASFNPSFRYVWLKQNNHYFVDFGIGVARLSDVTFQKRNLGSNWLFEDKFAIGINFNGKHEIALLAIHYSNGSTNINNEGTNMAAISYSYYF